LKPVTHVNHVDLGEVKRTHRLLARAYHPDLNATDGAREEFERVHHAYEQVLTICA
jgi:DnaJ-class molecular chaperone